MIHEKMETKTHTELSDECEQIYVKLRLSSSCSVIMYLFLGIIIIFSLFLGRYEVSPITAVQIILGNFFPIEQTWTYTEYQVIMNVRLPRIIAALLVGASLSMAGAAYQGLFKNPLVSPDILGVSSGAGFGAAIAILFSLSTYMVQISAFLFGGLAVFCTFLLSKLYKSSQALILVLSGVIISSFFSALLSITKYVADPDQNLQSIVFWLMGSLSSVKYTDIYSVAPFIFIGATGLLLIRWRINLLALGPDEAATLGVDLKRITRVIIICATLLTASAVCISGIVGWVGLVVPHICRIIIGPDYRKLLPLTLVTGACFMLIIDDLSRSISSTEIPLGILTSLIGAPFFAYLLSRRNTVWS